MTVTRPVARAKPPSTLSRKALARSSTAATRHAPTSPTAIRTAAAVPSAAWLQTTSCGSTPRRAAARTARFAAGCTARSTTSERGRRLAAASTSIAIAPALVPIEQIVAARPNSKRAPGHGRGAFEG